MSDHQRVSDLFLRACGLPPEDRGSFLEAECGGDRSLLAEVLAMLEEDARPDGTEGMQGLVGAAAGAAGRDRLQPSPGGQIGPYRIVERIGEGGMGVVYRAEQETPIRRVVALKLIRGAFLSEDALARFDAEHQTLARLDHPSIARVLDAGSTKEGQPYFAMELVHGEPIGAWCRSRSLDVRSRVLLFREVCRAVRHAHRRGIIHRDLKPSNVIVTEAGGDAVPKVIDFSIAKVLEESESHVARRTRTGQVIGTLEYMSPEQARGEIARIDTRTDVYSLGVLLYELLAERLPYQVSALPLPEAVEHISREPHRRLQTRGTTSGRIDGDLVTIVEKCLEKDPDRRYGSAAELVEDLDRHIDHRPILARPPSTLYQMRKLVLRHRVAAGVLALVTAFLLVLSVTMTVQYGIQRRERMRAEAEARKARQITSFLTDMLAAANPYEGGKDLTVREVIERAALEARVELADQPDALGEVEGTIGISYIGLGLPLEALGHLENALRLEVEHFGENHLEVARAHDDMAGCLALLGRNEESETHTERALAIRREVWKGDHEEVADSLIQLSDVRYGQSRFEEARRLAEEAIAIRRRLPDGEDEAFTYALMSYGVILIQQGRHEEADGFLQEAAEVQRRLAGDRHPLYLAVLAEMAFNLDHQGKAVEAIPLYFEVVRNRVDALGSDHPLVALSRHNLAIALVGQGRCGEAEFEVNEALRIWRDRLGDAHPNVAAAWENQGVLLQCFGDYAEAKKAFQSALAIHEAGADSLPPRVVHLLRRLGSVSARTGDLKGAEEWLRKSLDLLQDDGHPDRPGSRWPLHELGATLLLGDRPEEAERYLAEALRLLEERESPHESAKPVETIPDYAIHINALGRCLAALDRTQEGEALMEKARPALLSQITRVDVRRHELSATAAWYGRRGEAATAALYRSAVDELDRRSSEGRGAGGS